MMKYEETNGKEIVQLYTERSRKYKLLPSHKSILSNVILKDQCHYQGLFKNMPQLDFPRKGKSYFACTT